MESLFQTTNNISLYNLLSLYDITDHFCYVTESPRVVIEPTLSDYIIVKEFDDVTMTCVAYGHPIPTVRWSFVAGALSR